MTQTAVPRLLWLIVLRPAVPRWLHLTLKTLLTLSVLVALIVAVDPSALGASLRGAQWEWVLVALLLVPLNLTLDGWVWRRLLDTILDGVPLRTLAGAVLSGLALGFWTPARAGEYAGRALYLPDGDRWAISLTVFAQRMVDMAVGVLVGLLALGWALWVGFLPPSGPWVSAGAIGLGTGAVLCTFVGASGLVHRVARRLFSGWAGLTERTVFFQRLSRTQGTAVIAGSLARYLVFTGQFVCLGMAFVPTASLPLLAAAAALTFYAKYLIPSLTVLDLGIREGSAAFFFQLVGVGAAAGLNAALLLFAMNVLAPALVGLPLVAQLQLPDAPAGTEDRPPASLTNS